MQNGRAIGLLMALTGNFGIPGGFAGPGPARAMLKDSFMGTKKDREHPEKGVNYGEFPAWDKLTSREAAGRTYCRFSPWKWQISNP
ncbi:MAG: hypothetical protein ACLSGB_09120 [Dorea sp.]